MLGTDTACPAHAWYSALTPALRCLPAASSPAPWPAQPSFRTDWPAVAPALALLTTGGCDLDPPRSFPLLLGPFLIPRTHSPNPSPWLPFGKPALPSPRRKPLWYQSASTDFPGKSHNALLYGFSLSFSFLFFFFSSFPQCWETNPGLTHARQALYH